MQKAFVLEKEENKEKAKVTSLEIIVTGTKEKPYFEIKYKEVGKEDYCIGYSSYDLNNVFDWKEECFEIVNQVAEEYTSTEHINCSTDDLISRSVLIEKLKKWKFANEERGYDTAKDLVQEMIDLVKEQSSGAANDGWIPCSERLPELETEVLVCNKFGVITTASLSKPDINWEDGDGYMLLYIIAWQPLPSPYQPKGE